jgi:hypothetical protein
MDRSPVFSAIGNTGDLGLLPSVDQASRDADPKLRGIAATGIRRMPVEATRGIAHPREVEAALQLGTATNWFGGRSNVSTQLLDGLHYRGLLRVARGEGGIRLYEAREPTAPPENPLAAHDALIDAVVTKYAPLAAGEAGEILARWRSSVESPSRGSRVSGSMGSTGTCRKARRSAVTRRMTW